MQLDGIHHVTCITGDAPRNVDFYTRVLGLRLVKKTVNQDDPTVYHLFYADERGSSGSDITFFEYPGARPGRAGAGMIHTITWRVAADDALDFWEERLRAHGVEPTRENGRLRFADPEGLGLEGAAGGSDDEPPSEPGIPGAGTVHHVAWASAMDEHEAWRDRVAAAGARPTPVIDRFYFRSIYFREPSGVLFEIATL